MKITNKLNSYFYVKKPSHTSYKSLALISHKRHISQISLPKGEVLVVTTDWLLMHDLHKAGFESIYFESGLNDRDENPLEHSLYIRVNDWLYIDGKDKTVYKGVSLGKLFSRDISLILLSYSKLKKSLSKICEIYNPKQVYFYDYRSEFEVLGTEEKLMMLKDVCLAMNIKFYDQNDCPDGNDPDFSQNKIYGITKSIELDYHFLRKTYGFLLEVLSSLMKFLSKSKDKVVIFSGGHLAQTINKEYQKEMNFTPIFFSSGLNKSPIQTIKSLLKHTFLTRDLSISSNDINLSLLEGIYQNYMTFWVQNKANVLETIIRNYIINNIFHTERIQDYCARIDSNFKFYNKHKPKKILVDSIFSAEARIAIEVAQQKSIKVEYIWHGFLQQIIYFDALGGDKRSGVLVDRVYSWGEQNERWLDAIKWTGSVVRVGNPFASIYIKTKKVKKEKPILVGKNKNVLLLQYTPHNTDFKGLNANQYGYFIDMVRFLSEEMKCNVRLKLHPGVWKKSYYEKIKTEFNLNCEIRDDSPFENHVEWADYVIGPVQSGAFLEVIAADKHYYPVSMQPKAKMVEIENGKVYGSLDELQQDIRANKKHIQSNMLESLISTKEFTNPAKTLIEQLSK